MKAVYGEPTLAPTYPFKASRTVDALGLTAIAPRWVHARPMPVARQIGQWMLVRRTSAPAASTAQAISPALRSADSSISLSLPITSPEVDGHRPPSESFARHKSPWIAVKGTTTSSAM